VRKQKENKVLHHAIGGENASLKKREKGECCEQQLRRGDKRGTSQIILIKKANVNFSWQRGRNKAIYVAIEPANSGRFSKKGSNASILKPKLVGVESNAGAGQQSPGGRKKKNRSRCCQKSDEGT